VAGPVKTRQKKAKADCGDAASGGLSGLLKDYVSRPTLVFLAGVGFGVGVILGFGILADVGASRIAQPILETPVADPVVTPPDPAPAVAETVVAQLPEGVAVADVAPEADVPLPSTAGPRLPPEISNVIYMRADIDPGEAQALRSLPHIEPGAEPARALIEKPRVYVHAPNGVPGARMTAYVQEIETAGAEVAKIGRESFRVSTTHLRYYSAAMADQAAALASKLGIEARDFSNLPNPTDRIEVWVAGRPINTAPPKPEPTNFLTRFLSRL
jgi:hypothetical protein